MGSIWQARHATLGSRVAIKFLHASAVEKPHARARFLREAQLMAQLSTRRVVSVHDFGITEDRVPYLVMELVDGETLADKIAREERLSTRTTARILGEVAKGVEKAHAAGIVHRDLKPENILLTLDEDGAVAVKVADFGVAKLVGTSDAERARRITRTSGVAGTPLYMAPEQLRGERDVDASADVWAFGVCAYECVTGELPFEARDLPSLLSRVEMRVFEPPSRLASWIPYAFDAWFERACARSRRDRFPTMRQAAEELCVALGVEPSFRPSGPISLSDAPAPSIHIVSTWGERSTPPTAASLAPTRSPPRRALARPLLLGASFVLTAVTAWLPASRRALPPAQPSSPIASAPSVVEVSCVAPAVAPSIELAPSVAPSTKTPAFAPARVSLPPSYRALPDDSPAPPPLSASFKRDPY